MAVAYNHISSNKKRTVIIVSLFPICFVVVGYLAILFYHWMGLKIMNPARLAALRESVAPASPLFLQTNEVAAAVLPVVFALAVIWMIVSYFTGAQMMINNANATEILLQTNRPLYRLVENLCITRGLPIPKIYVIDDPSLNAFATGRNPKNSIIAVTSGLLENLDKAELQGVVAHELAHIENRDITIMVLAIAGIAFFTFAAEALMYIASRAFRVRDDFRFSFLLFFAGAVCAILGYVVAPILRFAMSRQREYLADASSVLITRNPGALADALEKISQKAHVRVLRQHPSMAAICIETPVEAEASLFNKLAGLYATHPPIDERIKRLRQMDGTNL